MWRTELFSVPRVFSEAWWVENDTRAILLAIVLLFGISLLPLIPIIWFVRQIKSDLIEYRRLKKILQEYYG